MYQAIQSLRAAMNGAVLGCEAQVELLLTSLVAGGHTLIQGAPGMGKTSLAKVLAQSIEGKFKRIQFTPDLLPADILGYSLYNQRSGEFEFHQGPVFTHILLADEINRTTPRIQSALLEAMNEAQVSIDGKTYPLNAPFFVIATQNHPYSSGTFPLPDSQLDRFLLSFEMERPALHTQAEILSLHLKSCEASPPASPVASIDEVRRAQAEAAQVKLAPDLLRYIAALTDATHHCEAFHEGISARGSLALMRAAQARAWLDKRQAAYPDDIQALLPAVFTHRLSLKHRLKKNGAVAEQVLALLESVPVP
jgi:MoxR-like ATPase